MGGAQYLLTSRIASMRGGEVAFGIVAAVGTWSLGRFTARRQRLAAGLAARAAELEVDRERARTALVDERSRIARELHDVIAHSVSLMGVQAGAARVLLDGNPDAARESLLSIEATAREAVDELRRLLGVLRTSDGEAARAPQPGLADVPALAEQLRGAGLDVDLAVQGQASALPRGVDLAAYRIVQEALTNALKHSAGRQARVSVRHGPDHIDLEIVDDGRDLNGHAALGHGLIGMRERAALYGGAVNAGPDPGGGYAVRSRRRSRRWGRRRWMTRPCPRRRVRRTQTVACGGRREDASTSSHSTRSWRSPCRTGQPRKLRTAAAKAVASWIRNACPASW